MKRVFLTVDDHLTEITTFEKGCWIHLQSPTKEEIQGLNARFALDPPICRRRWTRRRARASNATAIRR